MNSNFNLKNFIIVMLLTSIWIHVAEVARAILVAFPMMKEFYAGKIDIGPMGVSNALIWGLWDTMMASTLVFIYWLCSQVFGQNSKSIFISATVTTLATIGVFWVASVNSGLGTWDMALILIPISWVEMLIAAKIAERLFARYH
ncbi:hypothetical protein [Vibrio rarus]|uniref:hypothetical protein n=1 Tax=Vibrio rarus TaxID=413403 RepID=UPI0021C2AF92|nr:hypothetical protein [Vibrio rarus]